MDEPIIEDKDFEKTDFTADGLARGQYDHCSFAYCNLSNMQLNDLEWLDCRFDHCNLSLSTIRNARLKNVAFSGCKLSGIDFSVCNDFLFEVNFEACVIDYSSFYKKNLKKAKFIECSLIEVDFTEADLTGADFKNSNLLNAGFNRTNLQKADFTSAVNYSIDPGNNTMKKAKFSYAGLSGLLGKYNLDIVYDN